MVHVGRSEAGREDGRIGHQGRVAVVGIPVHIRGVADLMEKKSGHVQLDGRKAVTSVALDVDLADMVRLSPFFISP
jgi:coenzyme F420-reducing hydrogenase beta subunit